MGWESGLQRVPDRNVIEQPISPDFPREVVGPKTCAVMGILLGSDTGDTGDSRAGVGVETAARPDPGPG